MKKIILILIIIFISSSVLSAQGNPFAPKKRTDKKETASHKKIRQIDYPVFMQKLFNKINPLQHKLNNKLAELTQEIKEGKSRKPFFMILLIAFVYGIIHGIGPGHGKTITFSYFLSKKGNLKKGIAMSSLIAFMHAASAIIMVFILYIIIKKSFLASFDEISRRIRLISYGLIIIIGMILLIKALININKKSIPLSHNIKNNKSINKDMLLLIFAVGMVPCPGAVILLLFSISLNVLNIGIISTLFMALGMAVAIAMVGIITIFARKGLLKIASGKNKIISVFQTGLEITGYLLILLLGLFLFILNI